MPRAGAAAARGSVPMTTACCPCCCSKAGGCSSQDGGPAELLPAPDGASQPTGQGGVFIGRRIDRGSLLTVAPRPSAAATQSAFHNFSCASAGDVRLSDLKRALTKAGLASDWEGPGALVAGGGHVRVRLAHGAALLRDSAQTGGILANGSAAAADGVAAGAPAGGKMGNFAAGLVPTDAALLLEAALCPEYYVVRDLLYGQYHIC